MPKTRYLGKVKNLTLIFLFPLFVQAQANLIPNGSFEDLDTCPNGLMCNGLVEFASGWYEPIICTSDLYHGCADGFCTIPAFGGVYPYSGIAMAHIALLGGLGYQQREYIAVGLTETLSPDSLYAFSIRLQKAGGSEYYSVGSIGACFQPDSATDYSIDHQLMNLTPQLQRNPDSLMDDPDIWYLWEDTLLAEGGERFILLGNFLDDANTPFGGDGGSALGVYVLDDVRLTPISKPNVVNELDVGFSLLPNPAADVLRIDYRGNLTPETVRLLTVEGRQVLAAPLSGELNLSGLVDGTYLLQVTFSNGAVSTERVVVQR